MPVSRWPTGYQGLGEGVRVAAARAPGRPRIELQVGTEDSRRTAKFDCLPIRRSTSFARVIVYDSGSDLLGTAQVMVRPTQLLRLEYRAQRQLVCCGCHADLIAAQAFRGFPILDELMRGGIVT